MEALDYYGIQYAEKMVYPKNKTLDLPQCCIAYIEGGFKLWYHDRYYGFETTECSRVVSYLEIVVSN